MNKASPELTPIATFTEPVVFSKELSHPIDILFDPVVIPDPARYQIAIFCAPDVTFVSAWNHTAVW